MFSYFCILSLFQKVPLVVTNLGMAEQQGYRTVSGSCVSSGFVRAVRQHRYNTSYLLTAVASHYHNYTHHSIKAYKCFCKCYTIPCSADPFSTVIYHCSILEINSVPYFARNCLSQHRHWH